MRVLNVEKFLFCMSLETGGKILGYFGALSSTIGLFVSVIFFGAAIFNFPALVEATETRLEIVETSQFGK